MISSGWRAGCLDVALKLAPDSVRLWRTRARLAEAAHDAPAALRSYRHITRLVPADRAALERLVTLELAAGYVEAARSACNSAIAAGSRCRLLSSSLIDPARAAQGPYVAVLRDVDVETADWSILDGTRVYNFEAHQRALAKNPFVAYRASPDQKHFLMMPPAPVRTIEEPCIHVGGDANYAHWIMRCLLKLALIEDTPYETLRLLVNEDLRPHQREYLRMLGIPDDRLIRVPRNALVSCRELVVPTSLAYSEHTARGVAWLRNRLAAWCTGGPATERLFIGRRDATLRRVLNEDELERALAGLGFSEMIGGTLSVAEQIERVSRASLIVAVHGAAYANVAFAAPGAAVIEINSTRKAHMRDMANLARSAGLRHMLLLMEEYGDAPDGVSPIDADYRVDVAAVLAAVRRFVQEGAARN